MSNGEDSDQHMASSGDEEEVMDVDINELQDPVKDQMKEWMTGS